MHLLLDIDFTDMNTIFLGVGVALSIIIIIFVVILFIILNINSHKFTNDVKEASNSLRVFVIDVKNDKVRYFNRSKLTRKKTSTMTEFYNQFPANQREKIISWIGDLLDNTPDTPKFLEINVLINRNKNSFFSLLTVSKVDRENQVIYLESYILKYMYAQKTNDKEVKQFISREKFVRLLTANPQKGFTFAISFFNKRTLKYDIPHLVYVQIKNILMPYVLPNRPFIEINDHQLVISDLKIATKPNAVLFINTLKNEINRLLMINSRQEQIGFSFGVAENKYFVNNIDELLNNVISLSDAAKEDDKEYIFYEEGRKSRVEGDAAHFRTEVERIIQDKRLKYTYRPIYNVEKNRMLGYQSFIQPLDSFFDSIEELKTYAIRTEDDKELFATIARNCITRFIQEKDGVMLRLFFPIAYNEVNYVNRTFAHISNIKDSNIVLIFSENDLINLPKDSDDSLIAAIRSFKSKGYEVSLLLNDNDLTLNPRIYEAFDYFLISVINHVSKSNQARQLPSLQALIEKLLHFNKPIIATDIPTWELVEYIIKLGVEIVSSESISPSDENVLPLSKKAIAKLKTMN